MVTIGMIISGVSKVEEELGEPGGVGCGGWVLTFMYKL